MVLKKPLEFLHGIFLFNFARSPILESMLFPARPTKKLTSVETFSANKNSSKCYQKIKPTLAIAAIRPNPGIQYPNIHIDYI